MSNLKNIKINDSFWSEKQKIVKDVVIPYQEKILKDEVPGTEKSHAIDNFRIAAKIEKGDFYGMVFQDSDVAKWLEGVAYALAVSPDVALEQQADSVIDIIEHAQQEDGYLDTYFIVKEPEHRWKNLLEGHELYCAGHMIEAAVAYYETTGKDKLLHVMMRCADHIDNRFGKGKVTGIPGHQEIELALVRLYETTGEKKYLNLAQYFIDERGQKPDFFEKEAKERDWTIFSMDPKNTEYNQSHKPVREQDEAVGHAVRAVYMYTAMAALARITGDKGLLSACNTLWDNITQKKMYITAGIGSTVEGEAFSEEYNLPNDMAYAETCASIGLMFFARQMLKINPSNRFGDVLERALYNGTISGMQLDGKSFFYVNPLEVEPGISGKVYGYRHVLPVRPQWYACACCPPNLVRMIMSLGDYAWDERDGVIFSHLFMGGTARFDKAEITVESKYPWKGEIIYTISECKADEEFTLAIRIPGYVKEAHIVVANQEAAEAFKEGYIYLKRNWKQGDQVKITFEMPVRRVYCNSKVRDNAGKVALMRGPFVYCFEEKDNGKYLQEIMIPENAQIGEDVIKEGPLAGLLELTVTGERRAFHETLYTEEKPKKEVVPLKAIPYFAWGNRGENQMSVWMLEA